jgi:hypothetical protein
MGNIKKKRNTELSCDNSLYQSRFKTNLSFLRQTVFLINNTSSSKVQALYTAVGAVCFYITWMYVIIDTYVNRYDLTKVMEQMRWGLGLSIAAWMVFSCR